MMNISRKPSHLFAATVLGAVLCASFAPAHAGLLGGGAGGGLTANGRMSGQLGADTRSVGPAARTISSGAERTANGLGAQGAAQGSVPGGTQGSATGALGRSSTGLSGNAINAPTSSGADASLRKEPGTVQGSGAAQTGRSVDASGDAALKTPARSQR
jgi:hypothetical protein